MPLIVTTEGFFNDRYDEAGWVDYKAGAFWPDKVAGRIIVAQCLGDEGAEVYSAPSSYAGDREPLQNVRDLKRVADFHKRLFPWMSINLPFHMPDGQPGNINIRARPLIYIHHVCLDDSSID